MQSIPVIGFAAYSGTGKTTLIEKLVHALKEQGLRVAVIKHDGHCFQMENPEKDSWRFLRAGADISVIASREKTLLVEQRNLSFHEVVSLIHDVDIILVEGYKESTFSQIGLSRAAAGIGLPKDAHEFVAIVTDEDIGCTCPKFEFKDIQKIVEFILQNMQKFTQLHPMGRAEVEKAGRGKACCWGTAEAQVLLNRQTYERICRGGTGEDEGLTAAQIAASIGTLPPLKRSSLYGWTSESRVGVTLHLNGRDCCVEVRAWARGKHETEAELEALAAASAAALEVYEICREVQKDIVISGLGVIKNKGDHGEDCPRGGEGAYPRRG